MRSISPEKIGFFFIQSLPYLGVTAVYVGYSLVFGFLIGSLVARMRMAKSRAANTIAGIYLTITRCTPSIVLLFLVFYGLPAFMKNRFGIDMERMNTVFFVCVTFSVFIGASSSEIIRSAYEAVNEGQREAGLSIGMSEFQTLRRILLPQMLRQSIPNIGNTVIFLFKEGTLAYTIGLQDVLGRAFYLSSLDLNAYALDMYIALALIYWPITALFEKAFARLELRLAPEKRRKDELYEY